MKLPIVSTIAITLSALAAVAQAEVKVATVSMQDLYRSYYKRVDAETRLREQRDSIQEEIKTRGAKLQALVEEINKIKQQIDPSLSEATRKKIQEEYTTKVNEAQAAEQEFKSFQSRRQVAFQEMQKREVLLILQEIQAILDQAAGEGGYDLVLDASAVAPPLGTRIFPYTKKSFDITPNMMKQLNKDAPADFDPEEALNAANTQATTTAQ